MNTEARRGHAASRVVIVLVAAAEISVGCMQQTGEEVFTYEEGMRLQLGAAVGYLLVRRGDGLRGGVPRGDIDALETWLQAELEDPVNRLAVTGWWIPGELGSIIIIGPDGRLSLRDIWGNALVYQYPSREKQYVFRLYSVGPNGVDERGLGDDMDPSPRVSAQRECCPCVSPEPR